MATIINAHPTQEIHGKLSSKDDVYFYTNTAGKQFARKRVEDYQQNRSPKQRWNNLAFAYAHRQMPIAFADKAATQQVIDAWKTAHKLAPNGKLCHTVHNWKFAMLQHEWKTSHPYEEWYAEYTASISEKAAAKTQSESTSVYMLKKQLAELQSQAAAIAEQLANMEKS